MLPYYSINGRLVPSAEARLHVSDLAILRGYGIFDYFAVRQGQPMFFADYADRFLRSATLLGLDHGYDPDGLEALVREVLAANEQPEAGMRLLLTGGYAHDGYTPTTPNLLIMQHLAPKYPAECFTQGIAILTHTFQRELPEVKSINYLTGIRIQPLLRQQGARDVLYCDAQDCVRESDRSNFFIVDRDGNLATPGEHILHGVTRKHILHLAAANGLPAVVRDIHRQELGTAREAFLTSSTKGVMPVTRIDGQPVGKGKVGPLSRQLGQWFVAHSAAYLEAVIYRAPLNE